MKIFQKLSNIDIEKIPLVYAVIINLFFFGIIYIINTLFPYLNVVGGIAATLITVVAFRKHNIYFTGHFLTTLKAASVYILFFLTSLSMTIFTSIKNNIEFKPISGILISVLALFSTSFLEESLFRGLIARAFIKKYIDRKYGIIKSIIYPSLIFGITHVINIFTMKINISASIFQILTTICIGAIFTAIYLKGGNIFILIIAHTLTNAVGLFDSCFLKNEIKAATVINSRNISKDIYTFISILIFTAIYVAILVKNTKKEEVKKIFIK